MMRVILPLLFAGIACFARAQADRKEPEWRIFTVEETAKLAGVSVGHNDPAVARWGVEEACRAQGKKEEEKREMLKKLPAGGTIDITVIRKGAEESKGKHFTVTVRGAGGKVLVEGFKGPEVAGRKFAKGYETNFSVPLPAGVEYPVKVLVKGEGGGGEGEWVVFEEGAGGQGAGVRGTAKRAGAE